MPEGVLRMPELSAKLLEDVDLFNPLPETPAGGDRHPSSGSQNPSTASSSPELKNLPPLIEGRRVSWEDDGEMSGLLECLTADSSRGSGGGSVKYLRVVDGSKAIVLAHSAGAVFLVRFLRSIAFVRVLDSELLERFITTPSSESLS